MRDIYLISDTHFNHSNIIRYADRPFGNVREMDEALVENWNSVVKEGDHVYHLGDVYMSASRGYIGSILHRLNGKKRLILGNHDNGLDQVLREHFQKILLIRDFKDFGLTLSHIPIHQGSIKEGRVNVHGHIHEKKSPAGPYFNVCVEQIGYTPIHIEEVSKLTKGLR